MSSHSEIKAEQEIERDLEPSLGEEVYEERFDRRINDLEMRLQIVSEDFRDFRRYYMTRDEEQRQFNEKIMGRLDQIAAQVGERGTRDSVDATATTVEVRPATPVTHPSPLANVLALNSGMTLAQSLPPSPSEAELYLPGQYVSFDPTKPRRTVEPQGWMDLSHLMNWDEPDAHLGSGQPRDSNNRFGSRFKSIPIHLQVKETGPDSAYQAALLVSAAKYHVDPSVRLGLYQRLDQASFFSDEIITRLLTADSTRRLFTDDHSQMSSMSITLIQRADMGAIWYALETLNRQTTPEQFHDNALLLLKNSERIKDLLPTRTVSEYLSSVTQFDKLVENFRVYGAVLVCLENQLRGYMCTAWSKKLVSEAEYLRFRKEVCTPAIPSPGNGDYMKGLSVSEVVLNTYFYSLEGIRRNVMSGLQRYAKSLKRADALSASDIVSKVLESLAEERRTVEAMTRLGSRFEDRQRVIDYLKGVNAPRVNPGTLPNPGRATAPAHVYALHSDHHPVYEDSNQEYPQGEWAPRLDVWTERQERLLADGNGPGVCYAFTRGACTDIRCQYSHHPRQVGVDYVKVGERFFNHEGGQTDDGARLMLEAIRESTQAGSLDPDRSRALTRIKTGQRIVARVMASTSPAPVNPQRSTTPPPNGNRDKDRSHGGSRPPTPTREGMGGNRA